MIVVVRKMCVVQSFDLCLFVINIAKKRVGRMHVNAQAEHLKVPANEVGPHESENLLRRIKS
jgi:hypothetical protein